MHGAIFAFFALFWQLFLALQAGRHSVSTRQLLLFISHVVCVPLNVPIDFSGNFLVERGTGRNEHGIVVK